MIGFNGGLIGGLATDRDTSIASAVGVWTLPEQRKAKLANLWPVISTTDPFYNNVSLLLHGDGANGSTTFTDNSPSPKTFTNAGNVISTAQSYFGGASIFANDTYMESAANSDYELGSGDFTIECFYRGTTANAFGSIISKGTVSSTSGAYALTFRVNVNTVGFYLGSVDAVVIAGTTSIRQAGAWYHIAVARNGNNTRLFVNGVQEGSTYTQNYTIATGGVLAIGRDNYSTGFRVTGYIDEVRITKGICRYTGSFSVPTAPFPNAAP